MELSGSCLCGEVQYLVNGDVVGMEYDHCAKCQKATGSAFAAEMIMTGTIKWLRGRGLVRQYQAPVKVSEPAYIRVFCKGCGGPLPKPVNHTLVIPLGTLDEDPRRKVERHTSSHFKAPWYEICDDLPQHSFRTKE